MLCLVAQSCLTLCDLMDCSLPGSSVHGDSLGKNTGLGCHALLQGIFPSQGLNPGLLHCRWILYHLSHQGSTIYSCCPSIPSCPSGTLQTYLVYCSLDSSPTGSPTNKTLHSDSKTHLATGNPRNQEPGAQTACPSK